MPNHVLYGYVDGSDLDDVAEALTARLDEFVAGRTWIAGQVSVVNQKHAAPADARSGDLPDWDLGINLVLLDPGSEVSGWFGDVEAIALFLGALCREYGREFVVGIFDSRTRISEDLFYISTDSPDLAKLREIIGVGEIS